MLLRNDSVLFAGKDFHYQYQGKIDDRGQKQTASGNVRTNYRKPHRAEHETQTEQQHSRGEG